VLRTVGDTPALIGHLTEWAQSRSHGPERATILLRLGFVHERLEHDLSRAAEVYELAVAEDPKNTACLRALGSVYEKMRRWSQAAAILQRQARETTDGPERLAALRRVAGIAEQELHDVDLAIVTLQEIAQIDQDDVLSLLQLAGLCRTHDRPNILIQTLQQLVERLDEDIARTAILVELGEAHETRLKQRTAAREAYERALKLSPGYTPALRALARLYRDNGDLEGLLRLHEPEVDATSDPAVLALKAGRICFEELGDMERAIEYLWRAYRQNPDLVPAREILLQLLSATGKIRDAYDLLRAQDPPHSPPCSPTSTTASASSPRPSRARATTPALQRGPRPPALPRRPRRAARPRPRLRALAPAAGPNHDLPNLIRLLEDQLQHAAARSRPPSWSSSVACTSGQVTSTPRAQLRGRRRGRPDDGDHPPRVQEPPAQASATPHPPRPAPPPRPHLRGHPLQGHPARRVRRGAAAIRGPEDREFAANAILGALREDPGNPYAVRLLEGLLSRPQLAARHDRRRRRPGRARPVRQRARHLLPRERRAARARRRRQRGPAGLPRRAAGDARPGPRRHGPQSPLERRRA
jgi:tetratricopeptide (TPR) repeat protein